MRAIPLAFIAFLPLMTTDADAQTPTPPKTRVENVTDTVHGLKITDPYRWLENQESPETRQWLDAQNRYMRQTLDKVAGRDRIAKRISELLRIDTMSPVARREGKLLYWKRKAEQNQPVLFMRVKDQPEQVLIDPNTMSKDGTVSAQVFDVSKDGNLLAYAIQNGGEDEVVVRFRDLVTGKDLPVELPRTRYWSLEISPDNATVYYVRYDSKGPRLLRRSLQGDGSGDAELLFGDGFGEERGLACALSDDGKYAVMTATEGWAKSDVYILDVASKQVRQVAVGLNSRFEAIPGGETLFLFTTWKSPAGRVLAAPLATAALDNLKEIVPERKSATLESVIAAGHKLVLNYLENAASKVEIRNVDGTLLREVKLPGIGTASGPSGEWDQDEAWYGFTSFGTPNTWYSYRISTGEQSVFFKPELPLDPSKTEVSQVWVTSKDGTKVPMFLFHKKGLKPNAKTPVLLYGYGGFNVNLTPSFSATNQAWVEMGGVYAVPNLRGGGEFGEQWHQAGMFEKKQNVFDDFIASGEWLVEHGYGSKSTLAILGGSNGGLLVGAAMTQRPDLFRAVICAVPLLDMVRYHMFKVAKLWVPEYGSSEDPKQFEYIYRYSPYHHVTKGAKYPSVMFVTGDSDTRVDPLHARKMAALMQASSGSGLPVLLHYDTKSGHAGGKPVNKTIDDATDMLVYLVSQLGVKVP